SPRPRPVGTTRRASRTARGAPTPRGGLLLLELLPGGLDVLAEALVHLLVALLGHVVVVVADHLVVEVGADAAGELDGLLGDRAGRPLDLELGRDREQPALHEDALPTAGQQELDERRAR